MLYYAILHYYYYYTILYYTTLHYTTLHYTTLHYDVLYRTLGTTRYSYPDGCRVSAVRTAVWSYNADLTERYKLRPTWSLTHHTHAGLQSVKLQIL